MTSIEEWGNNKSEDECRIDPSLTSNNQRERAVDHDAATDDNLTSNTSQPIRRFSDDTPPSPSHTPKTTTTGCTTLPSDTDCTPPKIEPNQQSVNDKKTMADWGQEKREFKEKLFEQTTPSPDPMATTGKTDPNQQSGMTLADLPGFKHGESIIEYGERLTPQQREVFEKYFAKILNSRVESPIGPIPDGTFDCLDIPADLIGKKDPPVTEPTAFQDFVAGLPGDPTGTTLNSTDDYPGPFLYIIYDQDACYVRVEDEAGNGFFDDCWVKPDETPPDREIYMLEVPDWRHLRKGIQALKDRVMAITAQNQELVAEHERFSFQLKERQQRIEQLRVANRNLLATIDELHAAARSLSQERHELRKQLQETPKGTP